MIQVTRKKILKSQISVCVCIYIHIYIDIYFLAVLGLRGCKRATLRCSARASSHCGGFSCHRAWALGARASVVVARGLQ